MNLYLSNPGYICAAGNSLTPQAQAQFVKNLSSGNRDGIKKVDCSLVGENGVKSFFVGKIDEALLEPTDDPFDMRVVQILDRALSSVESAAKKAVAKYGAARVGVCIGSCDNGSELSLAGHKAFFAGGSFPSGYELKMQGADYPAVFTAKRLGTAGICLAFSTACSSSASALVKARELILAGVCDAVVAGGVDVASDTVLLGFDSLEAVSHEKTNPFSKNRNGINLGEGASVFVLSRDDIDGTGIVLAGAGESSDASHMTAPLADGTGAAQAMKVALESAGISAADVDYVNLHGTGTKLNDSMEAAGVRLVFGDYCVPASSTKPMTGHTLGAAGSLELAVCFCAIKHQILPLHVWDGVFDEKIPPLNLVSSSQAHSRDIQCCMSNSFAFGGCNVSLIVRTVAQS